MSKENNLSIPEEISSLSGALYISVIKNVVEENWNAEFEAYLHNFKQTLIELNGEVDEKSCLTELAAAQISAPALENGYEKTSAAIDKAAVILDVDASKLESPEYISLGRKFINWINSKPKRLIAAAITAGILFAGQGNVLIGPGAAYADSIDDVAQRITRSITNGIDTSYSSSRGEIDFEYDTDYVKRRLGHIGADVVEDAASNLIGNALDDLFGSITSGIKGETGVTRKSVKKVSVSSLVNDAIYSDKLDLSSTERNIALTGAYLLRHISSGLSAKELLLAVTILAPKIDDNAVVRIVESIGMMGQYDKEKDVFLMPENRAESLAFQMRKVNRKFDETESMIKFVATAASAAKNIISNGGELGETFSTLLVKAKDAIKDVYNSPLLEKAGAVTAEASHGLSSIRDAVLDYAER